MSLVFQMQARQISSGSVDETTIAEAVWNAQVTSYQQTGSFGALVKKLKILLFAKGV